MKKRVAFFGVDREDLKFVKFIQCLPEFEVALIADEIGRASCRERV